MGRLRPTGVPVTIGGTERHLLFTLNAIDEIQERNDAPLGEVVSKLADEKEANKALRSIVTILLNDEVERLSYKNGKNEFDILDEKQVGWMITKENIDEVAVAVLKAYGCDLPETDESDPNREGGQQKR